MKKGILVFVSLLGFLLVNSVEISKSFKNNSGIQSYNEGNFSGALDNFTQSRNDYNLANSYYKLEDYKNALEIYEGLEPKNSDIYHNIGNTHYHLAKQEKSNIGKRLKGLRKSLSNFKKAIKLEANPQSVTNKEIVEKEIKQLEEALAAQEEEKQNENQEQQEDSGGNDSSGEKQGEETTGGEQTQQQESGENGEEQSAGEQASDQEGENGDETTATETGETENSDNEQGAEGGETQASDDANEGTQSRLSEEQQEAIEKHTERLEQSQGDFGQYYNKTYRENQSRFESLFGIDPMFDNDLLNDDQEKKDW